jgi:hypothetical protein
VLYNKVSRRADGPEASGTETAIGKGMTKNQTLTWGWRVWDLDLGTLVAWGYATSRKEAARHLAMVTKPARSVGHVFEVEG